VTLDAAASAGRQQGAHFDAPFFCPAELKKSARSQSGRATMPATEISQNGNITAAFFHTSNGLISPILN
jgi:hypothetical protein